LVVEDAVVEDSVVMDAVAKDAVGQFLTCALISRWRPEALDEARAIADIGLDGGLLADRIEREELGPALYSCLRGQALVPPEFEQALRRSYRDNGARNAMLMAALSEAVAALAAEAIPVIVLKGPDLAGRVYLDIGARPMLDLDLLVHAEQAEAATRVLEAIGFERSHPELSPGALFAWENELHLLRSDDVDIAIELHWAWLDSPLHQRSMPVDWIWASAVPAPELHESAAVLGPEALLLHLCAHLALHHGSDNPSSDPELPWRWCLDIVGLLHVLGDRLDWDLVIARARESELVLPLQRVMEQVASGWHGPLPPEVLDRIRGLQPSDAELRLAKAQRPQASAAQRLWRDLLLLPGLSSRLRFAWLNVFPSPEYMRQRYGSEADQGLLRSYLRRWWRGLGLLVGRRSEPD
jgi:hypothetical protein